MPTISEIRPSGGGDYTTLAAWEAFADGQASGDQWAECYTGGNLGGLTLVSWTGTINSSTYPRIYAATGEGHGGDFTAGAYISASGLFDLVLRDDYVRFEGIRVIGGTRIFAREHTGLHVSGCLIDGATDQGILATNLTSSLLFRNLISGGSEGIYVNTNGANCAVEIFNNTIYGATYGLYLNEPANACTATAKNNIIMSSGTADVAYGAGTPVLTSDYNTISDATLTSLGVKGTDDVESATLAAILTAAASDDLSLASGSSAIDTGLDLSATIGSLDAAGVSVPQGSGWDRGALEAAASNILPFIYHHLQQMGAY